MTTDPTLVDAIAHLARDGSDAVHALHGAFGRLREQLAAVGGYLAEQVTSTTSGTGRWPPCSACRYPVCRPPGTRTYWWPRTWPRRTPCGWTRSWCWRW